MVTQVIDSKKKTKPVKEKPKPVKSTSVKNTKKASKK